jgi:uncharacterized protein (TIRG00374 family)
MQRNIIRAVALLSLGFFIYIVIRIDPQQIMNILQRMSWRQFMILFLLRLLFWLIRAVNWQIVLKRTDAPHSLWQLLLARVVGHAVGYLTPSSKIGGEAVRVIYLNTSDRKKVLASIVVDKTIEWCATITLIILGILLAISRVTLSAKHQWTFLLLALGCVLFIVFFIKKQRSGFFTWILDGLKRIKITFKFLEKKRDIIEETDRHISAFYRHHQKIFVALFFSYTALVLVWTLEIYYTFLFIGATGISVIDSFLVVVLGSFAFVLPGIPGSIGIYEVTYLSVFAILGIKVEFGVAQVLVRRVMGLLWALIGLFPMLKMKKRNAGDSSPVGGASQPD